MSADRKALTQCPARPILVEVVNGSLTYEDAEHVVPFFGKVLKAVSADTEGTYAISGPGPILVEVVNGSLTYEDAEHATARE